MLKAEMVFLELLRGAKTQKEMAKRLGISLSTVNNAIEPLARMGAIEKRKFGLTLVDKEKALSYWANVRNLGKDIVYSTRAETAVTSIEGLMPAEVAFTAFSAYRLKFGEVPADYSEVYAYAGAEAVLELKARFPQKDGPSNLIVLDMPRNIIGEKIVPDELMFVDLWNLKEWYAKEFVNALREKMGVEQ